ncbi:MAG: hypothetical protein MUC48_24860 [Leptolyngbya sp. Prado105]|nr:hypothetical protein [Leptolyngbya sp. Prado105]
MNHQNERICIHFSQDEQETKIALTLPTPLAKQAIQKTIVFLTGGSVFWLSSQLPIALPQKPAPTPTQISTISHTRALSQLNIDWVSLHPH